MKKPMVKKLAELYPGGKWFYDTGAKQWKNYALAMTVFKKIETISTFCVSKADGVFEEIQID